MVPDHRARARRAGSRDRWQRIVGGSLAALIGATAFTVWSQSVVNEKVYTVSLAGLALVAWITVRWCDEPDGPKADRLLVLVAYLLGLGYANHMAGMLAGTGRRDRRTDSPPAHAASLEAARGLRWRRSARHHAVRHAADPRRVSSRRSTRASPPAAARSSRRDCTFSAGTWQAFKYNFNREQYGKPPVIERQAPIGAQIGMWWLYFKWQWLRDAHGEMPALQATLATRLPHTRPARRVGALAARPTIVLVLRSADVHHDAAAHLLSELQVRVLAGPELGDNVAREVRDRDYFYLWSFSAWSVWAALGLAYVWETIAALVGSETVRLGRETLQMPRKQSWLVASPMLALAFVPLFGNWNAASRRDDTTTRDFAADLLNSVEPYGVLVTVGDNDTFPLWYAQEVEGIRPDVIVANTSLLNTDWYTRQLIRAPVREYDPARGPAIYRNGNWKKPSGPPVNMTMDEADAIPLAYDMREPQQFTAGNIRRRSRRARSRGPTSSCCG